VYFLWGRERGGGGKEGEEVSPLIRLYIQWKKKKRREERGRREKKQWFGRLLGCLFFQGKGEAKEKKGKRRINCKRIHFPLKGKGGGRKRGGRRRAAQVSPSLSPCRGKRKGGRKKGEGESRNRRQTVRKKGREGCGDVT